MDAFEAVRELRPGACLKGRLSLDGVLQSYDDPQASPKHRPGFDESQ